MSMSPQVATMRLARDLTSSELEIDRALESSATLLATMARARVETGAPGDTGQIAIMKLVRALSSICDARKDIIQTHAELRKIGQERGDIMFPGECPKASSESDASDLKAEAA
jgi:hypothetical protein